MWPKWKRVPATGVLLGAALALGVTGCPRNVPQDSHSGKDRSYRHPKKIKIEDNEGRSRRDIITYPGGDRVELEGVRAARRKDRHAQGADALAAAQARARPGL